MTYLRQIIIICLMIPGFISVSIAKPLAPYNITGITTVSAEQLIELILNNPDLTVIDSRHHAEYSKGHIEGAINILNTDMTRDDLEKVTDNKHNPIVFYCNGVRCLRSSKAATKAAKWGFKNIYWFREGWLSWLKKQYPIEL